jgi:hypothetical protein
LVGLDWSQQDLDNHAAVVTAHQLEAGLSQPRRATLDVIRRALEAAGVEFIDENGGAPRTPTCRCPFANGQALMQRFFGPRREASAMYLRLINSKGRVSIGLFGLVDTTVE